MARTQINLSWPAVAGASGYAVARNGTVVTNTKTATSVKGLTIANGDTITVTAQTAPPPPPPSPSGVMLGGMFGGEGYTKTQQRGQIVGRQSAMGRPYSLIGDHYDGSGTYAGVFGCEDPTAYSPTCEAYAKANGSESWITWTPNFSLGDFLAGKADAILDKMGSWWAASPVTLRIFHEFDLGATYGLHGPGGPYSAAQFVAAFQHATLRLRAKAPGLRFVWCPTEGAIDRALCAACFPGAAFVDYIGSDWYNTGGWATPLHDGWASFEELFHYDALGSPYESKYTFAVKQGVPFVVCETGSIYDPTRPSRKADWWQAIPDALARMPNCRAVIVYDEDVTPPPESGIDWRVDSTGSQPGVKGASDPATLAGFVAMARQL